MAHEQHNSSVTQKMVYSIFQFVGHLRQTNCRDVKATLQIQKRRELSLQNNALHEKEKNAGKVSKPSCQHPYRAFGAREMAQQRREMGIAATAAATQLHRDPREELTPNELRRELEDKIQKSDLHIEI